MKTKNKTEKRMYRCRNCNKYFPIQVAVNLRVTCPYCKHTADVYIRRATECEKIMEKGRIKAFLNNAFGVGKHEQ